MSETLESDNLRYRDAMVELSRILREIEGEDVDVDELAVKVERAADLVRLCRSKIEATEMKVRAIIDGLDADEGAER